MSFIIKKSLLLAKYYLNNILFVLLQIIHNLLLDSHIYRVLRKPVRFH
jgi:hypothetical protein